MMIFKIIKFCAKALSFLPALIKAFKYIPTAWNLAKTYKKLAIFGAGLLALVIGVFFEVDKMGNVLSVLGLFF